MPSDTYLLEITLWILGTLSLVYVIISGIVGIVAFLRLETLSNYRLTTMQRIADALAKANMGAELLKIDSGELAHFWERRYTDHQKMLFAQAHPRQYLMVRFEILNLKKNSQARRTILRKFFRFVAWHLPLVFLAIVSMFYAEMFTRIPFLFYLGLLSSSFISCLLIYDFFARVLADVSSTMKEPLASSVKMREHLPLLLSRRKPAQGQVSEIISDLWESVKR